MKSLILITSVIKCKADQSVFSNEERLAQTIKSIESVKNYLDNSYVVLIEGGETLTDEEENSLAEAGCDHIIRSTNVTYWHKSAGELTLLKSFFSSSSFAELREQDFTHFGKLSGRYELTENLDVSKDLCTIKTTTEGTWSGKGICETRFYFSPVEYLNRYIEVINKILTKGIFVDIEHSFYMYEVFPFEKTYSPSVLGVTGFLSPTGEKIND